MDKFKFFQKDIKTLYPPDITSVFQRVSYDEGYIHGLNGNNPNSPYNIQTMAYDNWVKGYIDGNRSGNKNIALICANHRDYRTFCDEQAQRNGARLIRQSLISIYGNQYIKITNIQDVRGLRFDGFIVTPFGAFNPEVEGIIYYLNNFCIRY